MTIALYSSGRSDEALLEFREALKLNPRSPEFHTNLGAALEESNHIDQALTEYYDALSLDPNYPKAQIRLKQLLVTKAGEHPE
jgi:protein O-GlcNAc transferase